MSAPGPLPPGGAERNPAAMAGSLLAPVADSPARCAVALTLSNFRAAAFCHGDAPVTATPLRDRCICAVGVRIVAATVFWVRCSTRGVFRLQWADIERLRRPRHCSEIPRTRGLKLVVTEGFQGNTSRRRFMLLVSRTRSRKGSSCLNRAATGAELGVK